VGEIRSRIKPERAAVFEAVRPGEYQELSGRTATSLGQLAQTYGIPFSSNPVNLRVVLFAMHELMARHYRQFRRLRDDSAAALDDVDADLENPSASVGSPALEEMRRHRAALLKLELDLKLGELVPKADVDAMVARLAAVTRKMGELLRRVCGDAALEIVDAALEDLRREAGRYADASASHVKATAAPGAAV